MNYFEFYDLPVTFILDAKALKKQYIEKSKLYHPDFFTLANSDEQERILDMSTFNNEAFRTLSDKDKRIAYVLRLKGALTDNDKNEVPQEFLMDMMEINEKIMELGMSNDHQKTRLDLLSDIDRIEHELRDEIHRDMINFDTGQCHHSCLTGIKENHLKLKYIQRLRMQLG